MTAHADTVASMARETARLDEYIRRCIVPAEPSWLESMGITYGVDVRPIVERAARGLEPAR